MSSIVGFSINILPGEGIAGQAKALVAGIHRGVVTFCGAGHYEVTYQVACVSGQPPTGYSRAESKAEW